MVQCISTLAPYGSLVIMCPRLSLINIAVLFLWVKMIELGLADGNLIDELMELTAQSLADLEIQEHFNIIKEIGRGKYGKVLLVTHRFRGNTLFFILIFSTKHVVKNILLIIYSGTPLLYFS